MEKWRSPMWVNSTERPEGGRTRDGNLLRNMDSTSITTMFPDSGLTYFSPQGTSRTLDHWAGPVGIHHIVEECRVLWQTGRRLQLITTGLPRDHLPILLTLRYILHPQRGETSTARPGLDGICKRSQTACRRETNEWNSYKH